MKEEIIKKYKNDKIVNLCIEMIEKIIKIKQDNNINEKEYQGLIANIQSIIESRITYLKFWEEK